MRLRRIRQFGPFEPDLDYTSGGKWSSFYWQWMISILNGGQLQFKRIAPLISPEMGGAFLNFGDVVTCVLVA